MKNLLLVYPPFCTPASPPYSLANMLGFLRKNTSLNISAVDLNIKFHDLKFKRYREYFRSFRNDIKNYDSVSKEFVQQSKDVYLKNHRDILEGKKPEFFDMLLKEITDRKPDFAAFSIVYSSQAFYASSLIEELKKLGIKTIIGGPAVNSKIKADYIFSNELEFAEFLNNRKITDIDCNYTADFSDFRADDYFTPDLVLPIKTASSCYYQKCSFCTHHKNVKYKEYDIGLLKKSLEKSGAKKVFIIDDIISRERALAIAKIMKELNISWMCQLKPTKDYDDSTLKILSDFGLKMIMWGAESGSDRILTLMKKGTNVQDVENVLKSSYNAGIKNIVYIMFGFPTETKEEFLQTIDFLKRNQECISLVSTTVFGLQEGTIMCRNPEEYGISDIIKEKRTLLEPKLSYKTKSGLTNEEAKELRKRYKRTIEKINKFPAKMNFFREHMLCLL
jgi:radical SAM superfamily enzyme YgiQ (UPF0313 family)